MKARETTTYRPAVKENEMDDLVERLETSLEKMANTCTADMDIWNEHSNAVLEAASRIRELEGEAEKAEMAIELLRKMRHGAARARDAALAENERLREALKGMLNIVSESEGVVGYHLNGDVAAWDEFEALNLAAAALKGEPHDT